MPFLFTCCLSRFHASTSPHDHLKSLTWRGRCLQVTQQWKKINPHFETRPQTLHGACRAPMSWRRTSKISTLCSSNKIARTPVCVFLFYFFIKRQDFQVTVQRLDQRARTKHYRFLKYFNIKKTQHFIVQICCENFQPNNRGVSGIQHQDRWYVKKKKIQLEASFTSQ